MRKKLIALLAIVLAFTLVACKKDPVFTFNQGEVNITVGDDFVLEYELTEKYEVEFTMSEEGIVSIDGDKITAIKSGETVITGTVKGKKVKDTIKVIVKDKVDPIIEVTSITVTGDTVGKEGDKITLTAKVLPENATNKAVTWTSSDTSLATVDKGVVTLIKAGEVKITAKAGQKSVVHTITIQKLPAPIIEVESVTITSDDSGFVGETINITTKVLPENATNKDVTITVSDPLLATYKDGVLTLIKEGTVTITAKAGSKETTKNITINAKPIVIESIEITGATEGFIGDSINLTVKVLPETISLDGIVWSMNLHSLGSIDNNIVSLLRKGKLIVTASLDGLTAEHEINIKESVAMIGTTKYETIQAAINASVANDVIFIEGGTYNELININKSDITLTSKLGEEVILTNLISISANLENITIKNLNFTLDAQIKSTGTLKGFTFKDNVVYDTNLESSGYFPIARTNVNAFIQLYSGAGDNKFGDIFIDNNTFRNIKSDIIALDRTMKDTEININNNEFLNFETGAIRFDGGYNNGTYNIKSNKFINDKLNAYSAIVFRAYAPNAGTQIIVIEDNEFKNIGDTSRDRDGNQPGSGVIVTSAFNANPTEFYVRNNSFDYTFNSVHLNNSMNNLLSEVTGNTFRDSLGYVFFEGVQKTLFENNNYLDRLGIEVDPARVITEDAEAHRKVYIAEPVLTEMEIDGPTEVQVSDEILYNLIVTPPYFILENVIWTSSNEDVATIEKGVLKVLSEGNVTITATYEDIEATLDIVVTAKHAATVNGVNYNTIQEAIDAANDGDIILVNYGVFNEEINIDKSITLQGFDNKGTTLTNKVTLAPNLTNISLLGFNLTGNFQVHSTGTLKGFTFKDNYIYDTDLLSSGYLPTQRTDVNAIIQLYSGAGTDRFGDIVIENNIFNNIQSDIIAIDRTMIDTEINIRNNEFRNFSIGVIRFDGGYNNGTYNIVNNIFENDVKRGESAITFRAYSSDGRKAQIINISENTFKNIGNEKNNPTGDQPASAVINTSTFNTKETKFNVTNNNFVNTHNSLHLRKGGANYELVWLTAVTGNKFKNPTGYIYYEDGNLAKVENNDYLDKDGTAIAEEKISDIRTATGTTIKVIEELADYAVIIYKFNEETNTYDIEEKIYQGLVGSIVKYEVTPILGYVTEYDVYTGVIKKDGSLLIEIYYEIPDNLFIYELEFNGGNTLYATRRDMVNDWVADYNIFGGTNYTVDNLPMGAWSNVDIHVMFYDGRFRDKWLWMAQYLSVVGSSTNKRSAADIISKTTLAAYESNSNWKYAYSYEVRAFIKGEKFTNNANWASSDYSDNALRNGFWDTLIKFNQQTEFSSSEEVVLPINVYLENFEFVGWYDNPEFTGDPIAAIFEEIKLYAKFKELNPVTALEIENTFTEITKGEQRQLVVNIIPGDAFNKQLLYYSSDVKVARIDDTGLITAANEGTVTITVTSYNGAVKAEFTFDVYPKDDIKLEFNYGFNGYTNIDDKFILTVKGVGQIYSNFEFLLSVEDDTIVRYNGNGEFEALALGYTQILIHIGDELIYTYPVYVQEELTASRIDKLLQLLADGNVAKVEGMNVIPYYTSGSEYSDPRYESVNTFLFDQLVIDSTTYPADPSKIGGGLKPSVEFIVVHDTANLNGGLANHGAFFANPANNVSINYIVGDYGVVSSLPDEYIAYHAGDGTSRVFKWHKTGVTAPNNAKPIIDISTDGFFTFNGVRTPIEAPRGTQGQILDKSYFTYLGPTWDIMDGEYVIGTTWFSTTQQIRGVIASAGGNNNGIGIEMTVNMDADIIDTVQRNAKLIAYLLEKHDLNNNRVIMHNTTDGKGDPYTLNNTVYKGTWYFDRFMEHVALEREILANYSDAKITFSSDSEYVSNTGRVIKMPEFTVEVKYTITVELDGVTKSIELVSVIPGTNTWSQNLGLFKPTQAWAKEDYRN